MKEQGFKKKTWMAVLLAVIAITVCIGACRTKEKEIPGSPAKEEAAAAQEDSQEEERTERDFASRFASPEAEDTISTRWWLPGAAVTEEEIRREIRLLSEEGFKNVELVYFPLSVDGRFTVSEKYGWDTEKWKDVLKWAFDEGEKQGVKINLTTGPMWPSMSPLITPDDEAAEKELNFGIARLQAGETYEGAVPKPDASAEESVTKEELKAVTVAKINTFEETTVESFSIFGKTEKTVNNYELDIESMKDITTDVTDMDTEEPSVSFTAPEDGEYFLFGFWQRGTGQVGNRNSIGMIASSPQSYCIDHLSTAGVEALTDYWDAQFLSDEEIRSYIEENNPEFFEDSLELMHTLLWTPKMQEAFERMRGYSMNAYLPLLYGSVNSDVQGGGSLSGIYSFATNQPESDALFVKDFEQTTSDLYVENHIKALGDWCRKVGFAYKTQSYGETVDTSRSYIYTDVPEGESLEYGEDNYNAFRSVAAASHMTGKKYVSAEYGAVMGSGFAMNWDELLIIFNKIASAGVNRVILHGFPYEDYQGADSWDPDTVIPWPGFDPFNDLFADHWNSHVPSWEYMDIYTDYISRVQTVLLEGNAKVDLAVYGDIKDVINGPYYDCEYLSEAGFTYDVVSPALLEESGAEVENSVLASEGISYKALLIGNQREMMVETAERILSYAEEGLPIYIIGEIPSTVPTYEEHEAQNEKLQDIVEEMLSQDSVKWIKEDAQVLAQMAGDGIEADAVYENAASVYHVRRSSEEADYYFFNNAGEEAVSLEMTLTGNGSPFLLDAWTGEIISVAEYEKTGNGIHITLDLEKNEAAVIAVAEEGTFQGENCREELVIVNGEEGLPEEIELQDELWELTVESWTEDDEEEGITSGNHRKKTVLKPVSTTLKGWLELEGLEHVSGIGVYTIHVPLDGWDEDTRAFLEIGETIDNIVEIEVNGTKIRRLDQLVQSYDLEDILKNGDNTITIKLATTLNNAVNAIGEYAPIFGDGAQPQNYGLTGEVTIVPYKPAVF